MDSLVNPDVRRSRGDGDGDKKTRSPQLRQEGAICLVSSLMSEVCVIHLTALRCISHRDVNS